MFVPVPVVILCSAWRHVVALCVGRSALLVLLLLLLFLCILSPVPFTSCTSRSRSLSRCPPRYCNRTATTATGYVAMIAYGAYVSAVRRLRAVVEVGALETPRWRDDWALDILDR